MKHEWRDYRPPNAHPMCDPYRKCAHCGLVQALHKAYAWGRVIERRWMPLIGRCKGTQ